MNELLTLAVEAHGGIENWNRFNKVTVHMLVGGMLWGVKGQDNIINDSYFESHLKEPQTRYLNFEKPGQEAIFRENAVSIPGESTEELVNPRDSFKDHSLETPWSKLQLVYFGSYAMWTYLSLPFVFTRPDFATKEIEPWHEAGETWRRLHVTFPDHLAYHSKEQIFYFDKNGLLKRLDYDVEISAGFPAAQYVFDYKEIQGIMVPTRRLVYARDTNGRYVHEPLIVSIDLLDISFI